MELTQKCCECGKEISDEEWVVNWCSCSDCFDKAYTEYMKQQAVNGVNHDGGDRDSGSPAVHCSDV